MKPVWPPGRQPFGTGSILLLFKSLTNGCVKTISIFEIKTGTYG